jgi:hypothetical protein
MSVSQSAVKALLVSPRLLNLGNQTFSFSDGLTLAGTSSSAARAPVTNEAIPKTVIADDHVVGATGLVTTVPVAIPILVHPIPPPAMPAFRWIPMGPLVLVQPLESAGVQLPSPAVSPWETSREVLLVLSKRVPPLQTVLPLLESLVVVLCHSSAYATL